MSRRVRIGKATNFKFCMPIHGIDREKTIKNFSISSRGRTQALLKIFLADIFRAHRAVTFVVAQLSCFCKLPASIDLLGLCPLARAVADTATAAVESHVHRNTSCLLHVNCLPAVVCSSVICFNLWRRKFVYVDVQKH